jgi:hypothetical protein
LLRKPAILTGLHKSTGDNFSTSFAFFLAQAGYKRILSPSSLNPAASLNLFPFVHPGSSAKQQTVALLRLPLLLQQFIIGDKQLLENF